MGHPMPSLTPTMQPSVFNVYSLKELRAMNVSNINMLSIRDADEKRQMVVTGQKKCFQLSHKLANSEPRIV
jgi:hypothetical protein